MDTLAKAILAAMAITVVAISTMMYFPTDTDTDTKITRHVSDEEFRQTQIKILDLRSELNRLKSESEQGTDVSSEKRAVDAQIARLMPILDRHQEQEFAKHYIEPARKAYLEQAESELRNEISKLGFSSHAVNLNTETKTMEVITSDSSKNAEVRKLFEKYPDIPITLKNGELIMIDH